MQPDPLKDGKARLDGARYYQVLIRKPVYLVAFLVILTAFLTGTWYGSRKTGQAGPAHTRHILYYVDPMNPAHTSPEPGLAPCGMRMEPVYADEGQEVPPSNLPPGAVRITPEKQQLIGVRLGVVEKAPFQHSLRALGRVAVDESRIYRLNAFVDGWVLKVFNNSTGSLVMKGEPLASFYSRDFITAEQAYFYALGTLDRLKKGDQAIENQIVTTSAQVRGAEENLENLGMSKAQIKELAQTRRLTQDIFISAPVTSFILARNVSPGQKFSRNDDFYKLADLSHVWILADLYDNEINYAPPGTKVRITLRQGNKTLWARVSDILPQIDPASRTFKVRLEVDNFDYTLRPDMFVDLEFPVNLPVAVTVPTDAIIDSGLKRTVFVDRGNGYFEPRDVVIGWRFGDRTEIVKGLEPGDKIAVSGNFLIDSESRMKLAAAGMFGEVAKDPICGLNVDESKAKAAGFQSTFNNQTYYFCSEGCKRHFEINPERYARKPGEVPEAANSQSSDQGHSEAAKVKDQGALETISDSAQVSKPGPATAKDPVNNLDVDIGYAATLGLKREYEGQTYFFRHYSSLEKFDQDPKEYINKVATSPAPLAPPLPAESPVAGADPKQSGRSGEPDLLKSSGLDGKDSLPMPPKEISITDKDPVCNMELGEDVVRSLAYKSAYQGKIYYFCSDECKREFDRNPMHYTSGATAPDQPGHATAPPASNLEPSPPDNQDKTPPHDQCIASEPINTPGIGKEMPITAKDPVCGKELERSAARGSKHKSVRENETYFFCSPHCKQEFDKDPGRYLIKTPAGVLIPQQSLPSIIPGRDGRFRGQKAVNSKLAPPPVIPPAGESQQ